MPLKSKISEHAKKIQDKKFVLNPDPLWYKDAVFYELRLRSFYDSSEDGIGDIQGLIQKLDYLQNLGITALWLLPFYPSPLKDDGYDISDYTSIHSDLGTLSDFKQLLREAHKRGMKIITELVLNHTSDQHPWFQRARRSKPNSSKRNYYLWSDTPEKYKDARIIFKDFEISNWTWDPIAKAYYWHRFYSHQPDLNYDNPAVKKEILDVVDFWLEMGVDGLRLDAVPYLFKRENTNCENLPETHHFLKELRSHIDQKFQNRMLLAEANQWPEDARTYFGSGDECQMAFHFPIMPRMFMGIYMEDRNPLTSILAETPEIPDNAQWSLFLRNHDELTLEMVTDEERDYMYKTYAQDPQARLNLGIRRRLAPLLGNNRKKIELINSLLFSLPGTPVIYYGDEIGMGDNIYLGDRNGVRTPMQWNSDRNAGFSQAHPHKLILPVIIDSEYHYETVNVEAQQHNPSSLLWWMKRMIALVKRYKAFGRGSLELLFPKNRKIFAFLRQHENETILITANLSRFVQYTELNLSKFKGLTPIELFGRTKFPQITDSPYFLTLGPHTFYWFSLEPSNTNSDLDSAEPKFRKEKPFLETNEDWEVLLKDEKYKLEPLLPDFLRKRKWFEGKDREIKEVTLQDYFPVQDEENRYFILLLQVEYSEGSSQIYTLPLGFTGGEKGEKLKSEAPQRILTNLIMTHDGKVEHGILYDCLTDKRFCRIFLEWTARKKQVKGASGKASFFSFKISQQRKEQGQDSEPVILASEQSASSVKVGNEWVLKLFRRVEQGNNPELGTRKTLREKTSFHAFPPLAGYLKYRKNSGGELTLAVLQPFIPNQGDTWEYTRDQIEHTFEKILTLPSEIKPPSYPSETFLDLAAIDHSCSPLIEELFNSYVPIAERLGKESAALHAALASIQDDPSFTPEPFTPFYQRALYQSLKNQILEGLSAVQGQIGKIPSEFRTFVPLLLNQEKKILKLFQILVNHKILGYRIRCHGNLNLKKLLFTGEDFFFLGFEGETAKPLGERIIKRSPLLDAASMISSFHDVVYAALFRQKERGVPLEQLSILEDWVRIWSRRVSTVFLKSYQKYLKSFSSNPFLIPEDSKDIKDLILIYWVEKAFYRLRYAFSTRPHEIEIQAERVLRLMELLPD